MAMGGVLGMLVMGLLTSVGAPVLVLLGRRRAAPATPRHPGLAVAILIGFGSVHTVLVLAPAAGATLVVASHAALLAAAVVFWLPVLGRGATRLPEAGRSVYLFLACPLLDMAALALVVRGEEPEGIAMIVGMLPVAVAAVVLTWRWIAREERDAHDGAVAPTVGRVP
jgi:hypothetical protein